MYENARLKFTGKDEEFLYFDVWIKENMLVGFVKMPRVRGSKESAKK